VVEDFRASIDDGLNGRAIALEVGDEDFDAAAGAWRRISSMTMAKTRRRRLDRRRG